MSGIATLQRTCAACGQSSKTKFCNQACYTNWRRSQPIAPRFWAKVQKTPSCWLWTSQRVPDWHGMFSINNYPHYAHRVSWELANGPIPDGMQVLHRCDVPHCVRPDHLFLGTQDDNLKDASAKGRLNVPRPNHARRKLTEAQVSEVINLHRSGMQQTLIAARYGVTKACISQIVNGHRRVYTAPQLQQHAKKGAA